MAEGFWVCPAWTWKLSNIWSVAAKTHFIIPPTPEHCRSRGQMHLCFYPKEIYCLNLSTLIGEHSDAQHGMPHNLEAALKCGRPGLHLNV